MLHAIIEVDLKLACCQWIEYIAFVVGQLDQDLFKIFDILQCFGFFSSRSIAAHADVFQMALASSQLTIEITQVIVQHHAHRIWTITMKVDQRIEAALGTAEQPVDWTLLIAFDVVVVELLEEIIADRQRLTLLA